MTSITPQNLIRHELIGLHVEVVGGFDPNLVGVRGRVVDETQNMLTISHNNREKMVPKGVAVFMFTLPDGTRIEVDGKTIVGRPDDRIKKRVRRW